MGKVIIMRDAEELLKRIHKIHKIQDIDSLLENVLHESRMFFNADAGTLYLKQGKHLFFRFIENDTLFKNNMLGSKHLYANSCIEINKKSLAGYVATTGDPLLIDDVYDIKSGISSAFNPAFDKKSNYKTKSLLIVPLKDSKNEIIGVLQLINALDNNGKVRPFSVKDKEFISYFAHYAADAIEKAEVSRDMILRMVEMAEIHDPYETGVHARRVGDYSLELYDKWAQKHNIALSERFLKKDMFRIAAILHDVGKVAIDVELLQRKNGLSPSEKRIVYEHTVMGARLFRNRASGWDRIAYEVVLNHHERWDGKGYPGKIKNVFAKEIKFGKGKKGKEIPLSARIVAIADVYDSLISSRAYKEPWSHKSAMAYIRNKSGTQFDPELVDYFMEMDDTILAIRNKYV
jgi:HD-GYP domain-containing protein (c-di-GMP phosphodiesterase class II)